MTQIPETPETTTPRPCQVCKGRGQVFVEGQDGSPQHQVPCPFCEGQGDSAWVARHAQIRGRKYDSRRIAGMVAVACYWVFLFASNGWWFWSVDNDASHGWFWVHVLVWLIGIAGVCLVFIHPSRHHKARKVDNFTDDDERTALTVWMAALALKAGHDSHVRQQDRKLDEIIRNQNKQP